MAQKIQAMGKLAVSDREESCHLYIRASDNLMKILERLQACECRTSECDGPTCSTNVSTTA